MKIIVLGGSALLRLDALDALSDSFPAAKIEDWSGLSASEGYGAGPAVVVLLPEADDQHSDQMSQALADGHAVVALGGSASPFSPDSESRLGAWLPTPYSDAAIEDAVARLWAAASDRRRGAGEKRPRAS